MVPQANDPANRVVSPSDGELARRAIGAAPADPAPTHLSDGRPQDGRGGDGRAGDETGSDGRYAQGPGALRDRAAFDELIRRYQRQAVAVSFRLLGNTQDALEVTQDAFIKAYVSLPTLQKPEAFGGWLLRIVSNLSLNYRRSRKNRRQLPLDDLLGPTDSDAPAGSEWTARTGDPVHRLQSKEMGLRLQQALQQLPEKQRLAILMFTIDQLPQKDVAAALDCSIEAVKWYVFQGRKKLKELLKEHM